MKNNGKLILSLVVLGVFALAFLLLVLTRNKPVESPTATASIPGTSTLTSDVPVTAVSPVTALKPRDPAGPNPPVLSNTLSTPAPSTGGIATISNLATQRNMFTLEYGHSKTNKHRRSTSE